MLENEAVGGVKDGYKDLLPGVWETDASRESKKKDGRLIQSRRKMIVFILGASNESMVCKFSLLNRELLMSTEN